MITKYEFKDIPETLYGRTYDIFSFEVFDGVPRILYIGNTDGDMVAITGLEKIYWHRPGCYDSPCVGIALSAPTVDDYPYLVKRGCIKRIIEYYEDKIENINLKNQAKLFDRFLKSITIETAAGGHLPLGIKHDISFVAYYYKIQMKVQEKGDSKTATVSMSCDTSEMNTGCHKLTDKLNEINNTEVKEND